MPEWKKPIQISKKEFVKIGVKYLLVFAVVFLLVKMLIGSGKLEILKFLSPKHYNGLLDSQEQAKQSDDYAKASQGDAIARNLDVYYDLIAKKYPDSLSDKKFLDFFINDLSKNINLNLFSYQGTSFSYKLCVDLSKERKCWQRDRVNLKN